MTLKPYREILDDAARDRIPDHLNLLPSIATQYQQQKGITMKPSFNFALAAGLALVVIVVVMFTVPSVATAMRRVLGYMPGLGLVEQGTPLRVLSAPIEVERQGIHLIVEKASSDAQRTILLVSVSGLSKLGPDEKLCSNSTPQLRLANGTILGSEESSASGNEVSYSARMVFPALPEGTQSVTLEIPCLMMTVHGKSPENWQIPLKFVPADPAQFAPVIELPTAPVQTPKAEQAQPTAGSDLGSSQQSASAGESPYGIRLRLDKVVELEDGYILIGTLSWTDPQIGDYGVNMANLSLQDANGQPVSYEETAPDSGPTAGSKQSPFAFKVMGKQHAWPLTLRTGANVLLPANSSFTLDFTNPPKAGETYDLNLDLEVYGHTVRILDYRVDQDPLGNGVLNFDLETDNSVSGLMFGDEAHPSLGGGGGGGGEPSSRRRFSSGFGYNGALPTGVVKIIITSVNLYIDGDWALTWKP